MRMKFIQSVSGTTRASTFIAKREYEVADEQLAKRFQERGIATQVTPPPTAGKKATADKPAAPVTL